MLFGFLETNGNGGGKFPRNGKVTTLEVKLFKHVFVVVEIFTLKNVGEDERIHSDEKDFEQLTHLVRVGFFSTLQELTYPPWGKGKSSSNMPYQGDMLIPWMILCIGFLAEKMSESLRCASAGFFGEKFHADFGWLKPFEARLRVVSPSDSADTCPRKG